MKIRILSDLHLETARLEVRDARADVVVLAGDVDVGDRGVRWALASFPDIPVIYVLGNHEYYYHDLDLHRSLKQLASGTNVHVLENDKVVLNGVRFLGCTFWTDFLLFGESTRAGVEQRAMRLVKDFCQTEPRIRHPAQKGSRGPGRSLTPYDAGEIHLASLDWLRKELADGEMPTVVVTHHAPARSSMSSKFTDDLLTPAFVSDHDDFVRDSGAQLWIHGHVHHGFDYRLGKTRVICNPRGYPQLDEDRRFVPDLIVEV
jgi:Icc-related predicted phosphoesterase